MGLLCLCLRRTLHLSLFTYPMSPLSLDNTNITKGLFTTTQNKQAKILRDQTTCYIFIRLLFSSSSQNRKKCSPNTHTHTHTHTHPSPNDPHSFNALSQLRGFRRLSTKTGRQVKVLKLKAAELM